jgi:hypothetical protein
MDIIKTKPGLTVASTAPRRKRFAAIPPKLVHAGVVMRIIPQMIVAMERNLPILSRWRKYPEGNWKKR